MTKYLDGTGLSYFWSKIKNALNTKANTADLADVATSGSYGDLSDTPELWPSSSFIPVNPTAEEDNMIVTVGAVVQNLADKEKVLNYVPPIYYTESQGKKTPTLVTTDTNSFQAIVDVVTATGGGWDTVQYKDLAIPTVAAIESKISLTQEQADWNQSDSTAVDYIKNKPNVIGATFSYSSTDEILTISPASFASVSNENLTII